MYGRNTSLLPDVLILCSCPADGGLTESVSDTEGPRHNLVCPSVLHLSQFRSQLSSSLYPIVKAGPIQECDAPCGISPHKRKSNFSFCVAYLMVPGISFDCNFDMSSAFSWLFQNLETDWWASSNGGLRWHTWQACLTRLSNPFYIQSHTNQSLLASNGLNG